MSLRSHERRKLIADIVGHVRRLSDIPKAERRVDELVGPRGGGGNTGGRGGHPPSERGLPDPDPARVLDDLAAIDRQLRSAAHNLEIAVRMIDRVLHVPTPADFKADASTSWPPDSCRWHRDILGVYEPAHTGQPTTVAGRLPVAAVICRPCYERVIQTGHPPRRPDFEHRQRTGKWPTRYDPASNRRIPR